MLCENCSSKHDGTFASGRFCNLKCSRSYAAKIDRTARNASTRLKLTGSGQPDIQKECPTCRKPFTCTYRKRRTRFCSNFCALTHPDRLLKQSEHGIKQAQQGGTASNAIRCTYPFQGTEVRCDSKLEYACLDWFERNHTVLAMVRCPAVLEYELAGAIHRYTPDFEIETAESIYVVECKGWFGKQGRYQAAIERKQEVLKEHAAQRGVQSLWLTPSTPGINYRGLDSNSLRVS